MDDMGEFMERLNFAIDNNTDASVIMQLQHRRSQRKLNKKLNLGIAHGNHPAPCIGFFVLFWRSATDNSLIKSTTKI